MKIERIAMLSVHTSPLAPLGGKKTGGMNVYVRELAQELGRRGIAIDIFTRRASPDSPEIDSSLGENVRVIHVEAGDSQFLSPEEVYCHLAQFTSGMIAFATRHDLRYDLIYSHYWLSGIVAHQLKQDWGGVPFVQMFHTLGHMKNRIIPGKVAMLPDVRITAETQIVQWADRVVAATPAEQAQLLWLYRADRRKIVIASPGVNTRRFHPMPIDEAKDRLNIPQNMNMLLFVGRIEPLKAVDTIIEALDIIWRDNPALLETIRLSIIGGNPDDPADPEISRLKHLVAQLDLTPVVEFIGAKDQSLLPYYYTAASAVLVPSDYESFGMVALEAMASGTPVIASEVGGLAFLVENDKTGFLVPSRDPSALADRITRLLQNPEKQAYMRRESAELARRYTWTVIADQLMKVFDGVVKRRKVSLHTS
jgi:D-inositol-3-phosphate glycosyltransferase